MSKIFVELFDNKPICRIIHLEGENMTEKDYKLIANVFNSNFRENPNHSVILAVAARGLADELAKENSAFNRRKFLDACYAVDALTNNEVK